MCVYVCVGKPKQERGSSAGQFHSGQADYLHVQKHLQQEWLVKKGYASWLRQLSDTGDRQVQVFASN